MKIPNKLLIFDQIIDVEFVEFDDKLTYRNYRVGEAVFRESKILLQKPSQDNPIPQTNIESYFCHEIVHYWFHVLNESELCLNEKIVNSLGRLLHQFINQLEKDSTK